MQPNSSPKISVIMGVLYRRSDLELLRRSVYSILDQTFSDFEFLICDDGSSAAAAELLDRTAASDPRIILIRPGDKIDLASKLNACLQKARGEYVARMDDDDRSHPDRFARQISALENCPDNAFVGCNVNLMQDNTFAGKRSFPEFPQVRDFYMTQPFIHPTLIFRREALDAVGGYSEGKRQQLCEDYDLLLRMYASGFRGMNIRDELFDYTIPPDGKGNRKMRHRWNEAVTRYERYKALGVLPGAFPYVIKPLAAGLLPNKILADLKRRREKT